MQSYRRTGSMSVTERNKKLQKLIKAFQGFLGGILGGIISALMIHIIIIDQPFDVVSRIMIDSNDWMHGENSLRWEFKAQPERKYLFRPKRLMWCYIHLEVRPNSDGNLSGIDLRKFNGLKFFARSTSESFPVTEFNLFVGPSYIQYQYVKTPIIISTKWQEFYINLKEFVLAPWDKKYRAHLVSKEPYLSNVTAFGMDIKTRGAPVYGKIWIDYIRLVDHENKETLISDCENLTSSFQNKIIIWKSGYGKLGK